MSRPVKKRLFYGIQRKVILLVTLLLCLLFVAAFLIINQIVTKDRYRMLSDQYSYMNERVVASFEEIKNELDDLTGEFILNDYVQKSLTSQALTAADREMMEKTLALYNRSYLDYYLVIDNKGNQYSQRGVALDLEEFKESVICQSLGDEYSKTRILWARDTIFGTNEMSFFAVRYIRSMNFNHEPGVLVMKLNDYLFEHVKDSILDDELLYFILDVNGEICFSQIPGGASWDPEHVQNQQEQWQEILQKDSHAESFSYKQGIVSSKTDENAGFTVITYAPKEIVYSVIWKIQYSLILVFGITYLISVALTFYFTKRLTQPIRYLSDTMSGFDESHLEKRISLATNTELDQIGDAYNQMVVRVGSLMEDVKQKEGALRKSELDSLMYQIRPHFLYNTLDTIYMLARIQKEETIMRMIQSLSRFLRINLSNGNEAIEVEKELEHVSSYLEIQKIRNADLFQYKVEMDASAAKIPVMKMILQPVAENCIKYGFNEIDEGGLIHIRAYQEREYIVFEVENNGAPMDKAALLELNRLEQVSLEEIDRMVQKKKGGYGIRNVVKRLRMRYGDNVRFYYEALSEGTRCVIRIPVLQKEWNSTGGEGR